MIQTYYDTIGMVKITCCNPNCGMLFSVTDKWVEYRRADHKIFYCPNGHQQHYSGQSDVEKLRDQLAQEKHHREQETAQLRDSVDYWYSETVGAQKSLYATKGIVTRIKNRVGKGVCPCCNRTFKDMGRHMQGQHPTWSEPLDE